jgi:hypothetical protein
MPASSTSCGSVEPELLDVELVELVELVDEDVLVDVLPDEFP